MATETKKKAPPQNSAMMHKVSHCPADMCVFTEDGKDISKMLFWLPQWRAHSALDYSPAWTFAPRVTVRRKYTADPAHNNAKIPTTTNPRTSNFSRNSLSKVQNVPLN